jgi:hypothetical protein
MQVKTGIQAGDKIIIEQSNGAVVTQSAGSGNNVSIIDQNNYVYLTIIKGGGHAYGKLK